jgi:hypothetical protein
MSEEVALNESSDFDSGFTGSPTETPVNVEVVAEPVVEPVAEPKYRQITEDEFNRLTTSAAAVDEMKATFGKQADTMFGKIGGLERVLKQYQDQTPGGSAVEITEDDLAELRDEYPELVAPQLKALQRIAGKMRGTGKAFDEEGFNQAIAKATSSAGDVAVTRAKAEIAEETLAETHSDWKAVIGLPDEKGVLPETEYRKWLATQPEEYRQRVSDSYSPVVIGRSIDKFNEHLASLKKNAERRDRFDQAVNLKSDVGDHTSDDNDAFNAGFNGR